MNEKQLVAATKNMIEWLAHPSELGHNVAKISLYDTFILDGLTYYVFKYKERLIGSKWMLGVCGGYEENSLENCGHTFSEMQEFNEESAIEDSIKLVNLVKDYWIEEAKKIEERKANTGTFIGFILLKDNKFNARLIVEKLEEKFNLKLDLKDDDIKEDSIVTSIGDTIFSISLMNGKILEEELYEAASNNYMCPEIKDRIKEHNAHILVAVIDKNNDVRDTAILFVKGMGTCATLDNALGVYVNGTIYEPNMYYDLSTIMNEEECIPIDNLVWINLLHENDTFSGYTNGLVSLGYDEIEVLDAKSSPQELRNFIYDMVSYVIYYDVTLKDGETIGFSEDDTHTIELSKGKFVDGNSLKISFNSK